MCSESRLMYICVVCAYGGVNMVVICCRLGCKLTLLGSTEGQFSASGTLCKAKA